MHAPSPLLTLVTAAWMLAAASAAEPLNLPIAFDLERPSTVTVVIEDAAGQRVRNLAAAIRLPPGRNLLSWDGYDDGVIREDGTTERRLVAPGRYRARGLTSDGLRLIYEFPVNSPGSPPWFTKERNGAWLADHTAAQAVVMVPATAGGALGRGQDRLIVSAITAECGDAFMALDPDGRKLVGSNDFGWTGAYAMAVDRGPRAPRGDDDPWLYCLAPEGRNVDLNVFSHRGGARRLLRHETTASLTWNGGKTGDSLAAWNGWVVISVPHDGELLLVEAAAQRLAGRIAMPGARGVLFDDQGRLLVATATEVRRYALDASTARLSQAATVATGLEDAQQLALDAAGNLFVGDWGTQHVVKMFDRGGRLVRTIGRPGGLQHGRFERERLHNPKGLAVDPRGRLWVADADHLPKRITAWSTADGTLVHCFIGGPKYGGGGTLDPVDRNRLYYGIFNGTYAMTLDWKAGTAAVESVAIRPEQWAGRDADRIPGPVPEDAIHIGNRTYLVPNFNSGMGHNPSEASVWLLDRDGTARPVAVIGGMHLREESHGSWNPDRHPDVAEALKRLEAKTGYSHLLIWSDRNLDGRAQADELVSWPTDTAYMEQARFNADLSFTIKGLAMPAPTILPNGVPVWSAEVGPVPLIGAARGNALPAGDGWTLLLGDEAGVDGIHGFRDQRSRWSYPSTDHQQITSDPGMMVEIRRFLGPPFVPTKGEAGTVFGLNGEKGSLFLMTSDGLFLQDLGGDIRVSPTIGSKYPTATRGMTVEGVTFFDEHYCPSLSQTRQGDVVLIAGKEFSAVFRVDGLGSVRRRDFATLEVTPARLAGLPKTIIRAARKQGRQTLPIAVGGEAVRVDGGLDDWPRDAAAWATLDERASACVRIVDDRLHAAWRTGDPAALANAAGEPKLAFKRGGAVDLMIGTDPGADPGRRDPVAGDLRLLVTLQGGKPLAVLYRAVVPGTATRDAVPFVSPVGSVTFDRVEDVSAQVALAQRGGDIELSVPLALLGLTVKAGATVLQGDIGLLRGTGAMTTQRLYWNNLNTAICSDVPSEARLQPANWGTWRLVAAGTAAR